MEIEPGKPGDPPPQVRPAAEVNPAAGTVPRRVIDPRLLQGPILHSLFHLGLPIMAANILQIGHQVISAFWVGRLGAAAVAAVSIALPVIFVIISAGMGFSIAGTTLVAQYAGAHNRPMVDHTAAQTLLSNIAVSCVLGGVAFLLTPGLLDLLGVAPDVHANALVYLRVTFLALPFSYGFFMIQGLLRGVGQTVVPLYIVAGTLVLNFLLMPVLTLGALGGPDLGVLGAALANATAQILSFVVSLYLLGNGRYHIRIIWREFRPDWSFIKRAFLLGYPASIEQSTRGLALILLTFVIASFGTVATAAYGIGSSVLNFAVIPAVGFSMATSALVGQNIGAGQMVRAEKVVRVACGVSFGALTALGLLCLLFAHDIAAFFVPGNEPVIEEASIFIRTVAWSFGFIGLQFALIGTLRASGDMMSAMVITLVSHWVLQFPTAYVLSKHTALGAHGLWWAFPASNVGAALISAAWFARGGWKEKRIIEHTPEQDVAEQVIIS